MKGRSPQNSSIFQFLNLMQLAGKENYPRALKALKLIQHDEKNFQSPFVRSVIKELTGMVTANSIMGETPDPFRYELGMDVSGSLNLGQVINNSQNFGVFPSELTMPTMIAGSTGSGKTNLLYVMASEIHRFNETYYPEEEDKIGCFFVQTSKLNENFIYNINDDIIFLNSDNLKVNPLYHNGHDKEKVFQRFIKLAGEVMFFREGSANQISLILEQLDEQNDGKPFSIYELFTGIKKLPKTRYEGVLENRISGMLSNQSGKVFDCLKGIPFERLSNKFVIIDITDLDFYSQQFIAIYIYQYLTEHFKNQEINRLITALFYDEGDTTFSKHSEQVMMGFPTALSLFTISRSSGIGAVVITHQPHKVITGLRSEAYLKIIFNLSDAEDARYMANACSLTKEEAMMISKLPNYHAIVSIRRCPKPFIIKAANRADELRRKPIVVKEKNKRKLAELKSCVIPREKQAKSEISKQYSNNAEKNAKNSTPDIVQEPSSFYFDLDSIKLLENIYENPFLTAVERYTKSMGISKAKGNSALNTLIEKNFIKKVRVKTRKGKGGTGIFLELTQEGLSALKKTKPKYAGKGNLKHNFYAKIIADFHKGKGHETKQEYKSCDVAVITPDGLIGYEVSIHLNNLKQNIQRNIDNGFKMTVLVFENKASMEKAKSKTQPFANVDYKLIDEFL